MSISEALGSEVIQIELGNYLTELYITRSIKVTFNYCMLNKK